MDEHAQDEGHGEWAELVPLIVSVVTKATGQPSGGQRKVQVAALDDEFLELKFLEGGVHMGGGRWEDVEFVAADGSEYSHDCDYARGNKTPHWVFAWDERRISANDCRNVSER